MFEKILSGHSDTKEGTLLKKADIVRQTVDNPSEIVIIGDTEADMLPFDPATTDLIASFSACASANGQKRYEKAVLEIGFGMGQATAHNIRWDSRANEANGLFGRGLTYASIQAA